MKSLLVFLSLAAIGYAQETCDVEDKACCHEDCCAPGTSWNDPAVKCVVDADSKGWAGLYTQDYYGYCADPQSCCDHPCCEDECCGVGTVWDRETNYCVPHQPFNCGPTGTGITFINCMLCHETAVDSSVCPLGEPVGDVDMDSQVSYTDLIEDFDPEDPKDVVREKVRILHVLQPLAGVKPPLSRRLLFNNITELMSDEEILAAEVNAYQTIWDYLLIVPKIENSVITAIEAYMRGQPNAIKRAMRSDTVAAEAIVETLRFFHALLNEAVVADIDRGMNKGRESLTAVEKDYLNNVASNLAKFIPVIIEHIKDNDLRSAADVLDEIPELENRNDQWPRQTVLDMWSFVKEGIVVPVRTAENLEDTEKKAKLALVDAFGPKRAQAMVYIAIDLMPFFDALATAETIKDKMELWNKELKTLLDEAKEITFIYEPGLTEIKWNYNLALVDALGGSLEITAAIHCLCDETLEWAETRFAPVNVNRRETTTVEGMGKLQDEIRLRFEVPLETEPECGPDCCYFAPTVVAKDEDGRIVYGPVNEFYGVLYMLSFAPTRTP